MPPDAPAAAAAPTDAAPAPGGASPPPAAPKERGAALIRKHVEAHEKARAEQAAKELGPEPGEKGAPGRDPETGKFLPAAAKAKAKARPKVDDKSLRADVGPDEPHKPVEPGATPGPATKAEPAETEKPGPSADSKARRLVREGKIAEAMQTIGLDPSKLESPKWAAWRKNNEQQARAIADSRAEVERSRAEMQSTARELVTSLQPFIKAKAAFDSEDYEEAFQLAFGIDLNSFQRKALGKLASPGVGKDPVIAELRKEISELKTQRQQEREQLTRAQQEQAVRENQQRYWANLTSELQGSDDPRISKAAERQQFVRAVFDIQRQHYDRDTDSTLPAHEAAELAIERIEAEYSEWGQVFGGASASSDETATRARIPAATGPSGTSARKTAKAVTTLNPSEAAEAAPATKLKGKALIEKYARMALANQVRANGV